MDQLKLVSFSMDTKLMLSLHCGENTAFCPLLVHSGTQSAVLKASFQKGNLDICCIVEYGVSGTMRITYVNQTRKKIAKSTF